MKNNVAIVILNYIQYVNIKPGIDELSKRGYDIDIYCPKSNSNDGFDLMFENTKKILKDNNYNVFRKVQKKKYKVLLEPYPCMPINSKYKIRYRYGMLSAKPDIVYVPDNYLMYDGVICCGKYDANYLSVFTKPLIVGNMKYIGFKKKKNNLSKKVLLYLPTYGDCSSIDLIINKLSDLRKKYYVIVKIHHGTTFLKSEKNRIDSLKNNVDEFYDCFKDLPELLSYADVVLSDNSGAIFEAMYANVPVAAFCDSINKNKIDGFNTPQYELYKEGILPYTNKESEIEKILEDALSSKIKSKQKKWAEDNFQNSGNSDKEFADIVETYLNDDIDNSYYEFHKSFQKKYYKLLEDKYNLNIELANSIEKQIKTNKKLEVIINENKKMSDELEKYKNSKLYIISSKIYSVINKFRRK